MADEQRQKVLDLDAFLADIKSGRVSPVLEEDIPEES